MYRPPVVGSRKGLVAGLLILVLAVAFEMYAVVTAMPKVVEDLGRVDLYAWAFTMFMTAQVFSVVLAGRICDRVGPAGPLATGLALFVVGLLLAGASSSMPMLLGARFLQGLGGGAINLTLMVVMAEAFTAKERPAMMTAFSFCWVLPSFIGPPVAASVAEQFGWHWVFWAVIPVVVVAVLVGTPPLLELSRRHPARQGNPNPVPLWAAAVASLAVLAIQFGGQLFGERDSRMAAAGLMALGLVMLGVSVGPLMPAGFWRMARGLPAVMASRGFQSGAFLAAESFIPLMLIEQYKLTLTEAGLALTIGSVGWTIGSMVQAAPWLRIRRDQVVIAGTTSTAVGVGILAWGAGIPTLPLWLAVLGWTIAGLGMGLANASTTLVNIKLSAPEQIGRNTSSLQVGEGLGNSLTAALAGMVFASLHPRVAPSLVFGSMYLMITAVAVAAVVLSLRIGPVRNDSSGTG